ncbi:hypothetical protein RU98_GL000376 [Enterococcus caccae]|nr:hypothetical protein RU98_GL000376 [Enterococcus caccae]
MCKNEQTNDKSCFFSLLRMKELFSQREDENAKNKITKL